MAEESTTGLGGLKSASDRIRETAKWLTISLGTVGALLLAGTSLSSIGKLAPGSDRLTVAVIGGALAALGTVLVLVGSVRTATTPVITLAALTSDKPPSGTKKARTDGFMLGEGKYANVNELAADYLRKTQARAEALDAADNARNAKERKRLNSAADEASNDALDVGERVGNMLALSSFEHLSRRWHQALAMLIVGGIIAGLGVLAFVWAANPPADANATTASPALISTATTVVLELNDAGQRSLSQSAGCDLSDHVDALKVGTTADGPDVVIVADGCKHLRVIITPEWGTVNSG